MNSTTAQFGGFVFTTDNDQHPILSTAQRLIDVWVLVGVQMNILLMAAVPALEGVNTLSHRLLAWMDLAEAGMLWVGKAVNMALDTCAIVYDAWLIMWEPLYQYR